MPKLCPVSIYLIMPGLLIPFNPGRVLYFHRRAGNYHLLKIGTYLPTVEVSSSDPIFVMRRAGKNNLTQVFEISLALESLRSFHLEAITP